MPAGQSDFGLSVDIPLYIYTQDRSWRPAAVMGCQVCTDTPLSDVAQQLPGLYNAGSVLHHT
jgi:hypothetical protein